MNFDKIFRQAILFIVLAELVSLLVFLLPDLKSAAFFGILIIALALSVLRLDYGIYMALTELFIGSKGHLFSFTIDDFTISIRIGLWIIIMSVWAIKLLIRCCGDSRGQSKQWLEHFTKHKFLPYFAILFAFIAWGLINGWLNNNDLKNIFYDFNGWLYFTYLFPLYLIFKNNPSAQFKKIWQLLLAAAIWLSAKSLILLFIFSHNMTGAARIAYRWVRDTGVGEITLIQGGFYRVFFQSHIYVLIAFFVFFLFAVITFKKTNFLNKKYGLIFFFLILFSAINLLNFSRSNWAGIIFCLLFAFAFIFKKYGWQKIIIAALVLFFSTLLSFGLVVGIVKFPYPNPLGGFDTASLISQRASQFTDEAGISSRWSLYPELWQKIKFSPILGQGFGTTVTYVSSDPRVLENSPDGKYTTYAFEWGWSDIWLKLGIFGLIIYIALVIKIIIIGLVENKEQKANINLIILKNGLTFGLTAIVIISFFSPYLNHPLGIGYIILLSAILDKK
ncbi:MAG: O-antigen ligase family protein [Patescibacteria group bacterium]|nr:O-antigen ligase family protein [Patescibacteria group bacterium]